MRQAIILTLGLATFGVSYAQNPDWNPGTTETFQWPGFTPELSVRVPDNYTTDRKWPIAFHYHTIGMEPNFIVPGTYSGNRDFILVAMTYKEEQPQVFTQKEDYWEREFQILRDIRAKLVSRQLQVDVARTYVGGDGVGGWYASHYADLFGNELAGIYMTGAGKFGSSPIKGKPFQKRGKPIYIGAAQLELNFGYSLNGKTHFTRLGGRVTLDEYTAQKHIVPMDQVYVSERMRQWFQIEGNRTTPEVGRQFVGEWKVLVEKKLAGLSSPLDRMLFLDHLTSFPFYPALPADFRAQLQATNQQLQRDPKLKPEFAAKKVYEQLLVYETRDFSIEARRNVAHQYANLYKQYPETHYGKRAGIAVNRMRDLVENPDRFVWNDFGMRAQFLKDVAERPLPELPDEKLLHEMERVSNLVYIN
ncbi:MAG: hypothetical protein AAF585_10100 [Verrucomicrobiota bacterium]